MCDYTITYNDYPAGGARMPVDGEAVRLRAEADEPGWEVDPDDDWAWP
ncbi:hypothetical protein ACH45E_34570 [Streptomyces sp. NPDC020299]